MDSNNPKNQTPQPTPAAQQPQSNQSQQVSQQTPVPESVQTPQAQQVSGAAQAQTNTSTATTTPAASSTPGQAPQAGLPQMPGGVQAPPPSMPERIRRDFSFAQVLASVFSTVTCMVLAPKIGLLGGLLGAAIGAGVAAVASQVYKSILYNTSDKIKYKQALIMAHAHRKGTKQDKASSQPNQQASLTGQMKAMAENSLINTMEVAAHITEEPPSEVESSTPTTTPTQGQAPISAPQSNENVETGEQKTHIWRYILVIAGVTMLSVALSVGVIDYLTKGEGWGKKPEVVYITRYITSHDDNAAPAVDQSNNSSSASAQSQDANQKDKNTQQDDKNPEESNGQNAEQGQNQQGSQSQNDGKNQSEKNQTTGASENKDTPQKSVQATKSGQDSGRNN